MAMLPMALLFELSASNRLSNLALLIFWAIAVTDRMKAKSIVINIRLVMMLRLYDKGKTF
jgi:hypothetical protein